MADPGQNVPSVDEGRRWLRQLTEVIAGWSRGELDRPLPDRRGIADLPSELVELHAGLESARRVLQGQQTDQRLGILHDPLTGLPNRAHFSSLVRGSAARLARHGGDSTMLLLDLDDFRHVNDELGQEAGDRLLQAVAERLASAMRAGDAMARLGGDEFALLLEGTGVEGATCLAERVLASFTVPFSLVGHEVTVTASIGLAAVEPDAMDPAELLRRCDVAMYVAKRSGKSRAAAFEASMDDATRGRLRLAADLRHAPDRDELRLHYQPLFSLESGRVISLEALVRWEHPTRGLLAPGAFIGLAEETGLIVPVGEWVLGQAASEQARLQDLFEPAPGFPVHVNVSARQFHDPGLVEMVAAALDRYGIPPGCLGIEITESLVLDEIDVTVRHLSRLRDLGTIISVDDFGIGYSSLTYLRQFPIDVLKLDRTFIEHIADEVESRVVVRAVIRLGHDLGLSVVAEGVETDDQMALLRDWGCDAAQGYLLSRPLPADQLDDFLHQWDKPSSW